MSPAARLGAFGLVLGLALGGGALVGNAAGPIGTDEPAADDHEVEHSSTEAEPEPGDSTSTSASAVVVDGYEVALGGTLVAGEPGELTFAVRDRKSTRLNSSHCALSRMPSSA